MVLTLGVPVYPPMAWSSDRLLNGSMVLWLLRNQGKSGKRVKYGLPKHGPWVWRVAEPAGFEPVSAKLAYSSLRQLAWQKAVCLNSPSGKDTSSRQLPNTAPLTHYFIRRRFYLSATAYKSVDTFWDAAIESRRLESCCRDGFQSAHQSTHTFWEP